MHTRSFFLFVMVTACTPNTVAPVDTDTTDTDSIDTDDMDTDDSDVASSANVFIHVRANDDVFAHSDGLSGQTPDNHEYGFTAFQMLRDRNDASPMEVFDFGADYVVASYQPGADTIVAEVPAKDLERDTFTWGKTAISHFSMTIDTKVHAFGLHIPGTVDITHVLSDGIDIDGTSHDSGWWKYEFVAGTTSFPMEGTTGAPPQAPTGAPLEVVVENGRTWVYFPLLLDVEPASPDDVHIVMDFNVHESFRWLDADEPDFDVGVFDTTSTSTESIERIGANDYSIYYE
jgi:hypothetical protein